MYSRLIHLVSASTLLGLPHCKVAQPFYQADSVHILAKLVHRKPATVLLQARCCLLSCGNDRMLIRQSYQSLLRHRHYLPFDHRCAVWYCTERCDVTGHCCARELLLAAGRSLCWLFYGLIGILILYALVMCEWFLTSCSVLRLCPTK